MLNNITLGKYYKTNSIIHNLNPIFKIISLVLMIISIFFIDSYVDLIMLVSYLLLAMLYSNININTYLKNLLAIKIFIFFILIIDLIFFTSFSKIIYDIFKIIFIILYSSLLTYTTVITEITYGIEKILYPLKRIIKVWVD